MNMLCKVFGHKWEHCKCSRCGEKRDKDHAWDGCVCSVCRKERDEGHIFDLVPGSYHREIYGNLSALSTTHQFKCRKCGQLKNEEHKWIGKGCMTKCAICGAVPLRYEPRLRGDLSIDVSHQWTGETCRDICTLCGAKFPGGHRWTGSTCNDHCEICGERYPDGHVFEEAGSRRTSYGTRVGLYRCKYCGEEYEEPYDFSSSDSV